MTLEGGTRLEPHLWGGSPDPRATSWSRHEPGQEAGLRTGTSAPQLSREYFPAA